MRLDGSSKLQLALFGRNNQDGRAQTRPDKNKMTPQYQGLCPLAPKLAEASIWRIISVHNGGVCNPLANLSSHYGIIIT